VTRKEEGKNYSKYTTLEATSSTQDICGWIIDKGRKLVILVEVN
jgi:hypothetical protein